MKKSAAFGIAIVPNDVVTKRAMRLSRALEKHGGLFVLDQRLYSTHVTLYMVELPLENLLEARQALKKIAASQHSFKLDALIWNQSRNGYINVSYKKTKILSELQKTIIKELNPLRESLLRQKDVERLKTANGTEKRNIQKYGFRSVAGQFDPHLTISKLAGRKLAVMPRIDPRKMSFTAHEVGMFYLGEHGSCKKLVAKHRLGAR